MPLTQRFAVALKHYRELAQMSQEDLAAASDLDRTYISQLERALKSPTLNTLEKLATRLGIEAQYLLREPRGLNGPRVPGSYIMCPERRVAVARDSGHVHIPTTVLTSSINLAHELIDDMYAIDLDIAAILGLRNLSAFIGELVAAAMVKTGDGLFEPNPHQDGYPDLLLMDPVGQAEWRRLDERRTEKAPFSPFSGGGIELKATCGGVPSPAICRRRGIERPAIGDTRIGSMTGYDWKAHHRETNNLVGILWDFIAARPRVAAMFYASDLNDDDWGSIVQPRASGGRTTSVSIMNRSGIAKMYAGWLCVLSDGEYAAFLNRRNRGEQIPLPT